MEDEVLGHVLLNEATHTSLLPPNAQEKLRPGMLPKQRHATERFEHNSDLPFGLPPSWIDRTAQEPPERRFILAWDATRRRPVVLTWSTIQSWSFWFDESSKDEYAVAADFRYWILIPGPPEESSR